MMDKNIIEEKNYLWDVVINGEGGADTILKLSDIYFFIEKDMEKVKGLLVPLMERGNLEAKFKLAMMYFSDEKTFDIAEKLLVELVNTEYVDTIFYLGTLYMVTGRYADALKVFHQYPQEGELHPYVLDSINHIRESQKSQSDDKITMTYQVDAADSQAEVVGEVHRNEEEN